MQRLRNKALTSSRISDFEHFFNFLYLQFPHHGESRCEKQYCLLSTWEYFSTYVLASMEATISIWCDTVFTRRPKSVKRQMVS
jgi:hypothetical protein